VATVRLLIISDRYPPFSIGGYEIACHAVSERLRARGHDVRVLTSNYGLARSRVDGHVHRVLRRPQDSSSLLRLGLWEVSDRRSLRVFKEWRPDVIYAWCLRQLFPAVHAALRGIGAPIVYNVQDIWIPAHAEDDAERRATWLRRGSGPIKAVVKAAVRGALLRRDPGWLNPLEVGELDLRHLVFCSRFRQRQHIEGGLPLGSSVVIYNGVDLQAFRNAPAGGGARLRLLFVGRLVESKGAHTAIAAMRQLVQDGRRDVELTVAGVPAHPWAYAMAVRDAVRDLQNRVALREGVPHGELPSLYKAHDVLLFPSIGAEGFPVVVLEAMACGLAVVGTTTGGTAEILVDGETGLVVPPGDPDAIAKAVTCLMADPRRRSALAAEAQSRVRERFDIEKIALETETHLAAVGRGA
jgi:glycosyltransferase involved in cell wall biosynthesis